MGNDPTGERPLDRSDFTALLAAQRRWKRDSFEGQPSLAGPPDEHPDTFSWRGHAHLAPVSNQLPHNTCVAHSGCRLAETLAAMAGEPVALEATEFHQCVLGLNGMTAVPQASQALIPLRDTGAPKKPQGSFAAGAPCPAPGARHRLVGLNRLFTAQTAKAWIAHRAPVIAVISVEERFIDCRGFGIYSDGNGERRLHHALLLIGYDENSRCWIVQNSFGREWGEEGFGRIAYGHAMILADNGHPLFCAG